MNTVPIEFDFALNQVSELGDDLLRRLDDLRQHSPIAWSETNQVWMVTGHAEVAEGYMGKLPLSAGSLPDGLVAQISPEDRARYLPHVMSVTKEWVMESDGERHARLRRLGSAAFSPRLAESLKVKAQQFIKEALDSAEQKKDIEFVNDIALKIPGRMILHILGLPEEHLPHLKQWSQILLQLGNINGTLEEVRQIEDMMIFFRKLFEPELAKRRENPTDDFLSALVTANEAGDKLSDSEMYGLCETVFIGGFDSTANSLTLATAALARNPDACDYIRTNPQDISKIAMELLRVTAMSTVLSRRVIEDFEWHGRQMKAGQLVFLFQGAGNRDPEVFSNPDVIDFSRGQNQNLAFGRGPHTCLGRPLAMMQMSEFFPELLRRFDLEMLDNDLSFLPLLGFRGLTHLNMRLNSRQ